MNKSAWVEKDVERLIEEHAKNTPGGLTEEKKKILRQSYEHDEKEFKFWEREEVRLKWDSNRVRLD